MGDVIVESITAILMTTMMTILAHMISYSGALVDMKYKVSVASDRQNLFFLYDSPGAEYLSLFGLVSSCLLT